VSVAHDVQRNKILLPSRFIGQKRIRGSCLEKDREELSLKVNYVLLVRSKIDAFCKTPVISSYFWSPRPDFSFLRLQLIENNIVSDMRAESIQ
jgi:hypothetical protein